MIDTLPEQKWKTQFTGCWSGGKRGKLGSQGAGEIGSRGAAEDSLAREKRME
jgi:hypothetical protein